MRGEPRILLPTTNPFFLPFVLVATRPLHGRRVVPLIYDLWPDALEAAGLARPGRLLSYLAGLANRFVFGRADGVVFIGTGMSAHARARYGEPRLHTVIETGADAAEFEPGAVGPGAPESELETWCNGKLVISYVGNLGAMHDWETLAEALPRLAAGATDGPRLGIVIAASGGGAQRLREALRGVSGDVVRFEPPLADRKWVRLLARSAISLVSLRSEAARTSIPSKTFSAMAAGNAIVAVAPGDSDVARVVLDNGIGEVVCPGDADGLEAVLRMYAADGNKLQAVRERSRTVLRQRYDMAALSGRWMEFLDVIDRRPMDRPLYEAVKRALDVAASGVGLAVLSPILAAVAMAVALDVGRPVMFRQKRPGLAGRPFELMKFRTMRAARPGEEGPEGDGARITRLGRFLRATSLDELPTLWNVLRGDMSLVGPRPLLIRYLERYSPRQARRHEVRPGITGWAQVNGRNAVSWDEKLDLDVWYVDRRSLVLDLRILAATIGKVFRREGISADGHATAPEFTGPSSEG